MGEMRELELDAVVELDMKLYEEERIQLLSDLYSTNRELLPETGEVCFDQILTKNLCKCKISEKWRSAATTGSCRSATARAL